MCCTHLLHGEIPYALQNIETGEIKEYPYFGMFRIDASEPETKIMPNGHSYYSEGGPKSVHPGFYYVSGSGCGYVYFNGSDFRHNGYEILYIKGSVIPLVDSSLFKTSLNV